MNRVVSIIIPIYNEEQRIHRCVDSVVGQTYEDLEIILVDDGSTDRSGEICDAYAKIDPRIIVIHQPNRGLSAARNAGLDVASSDFIQFADGDDFLLPTMTEELMIAIHADDAAAAQCRFFMLSDQDPIAVPKETTSENKQVTYCGDDILSLIAKDHFNTTVQWNKIFRRDIFDDLRYPVGKYHEDEFVIHRELAKMDAITCIDRRLYCYIRHPGSITHQRDLEKLSHACEAYLDRLNFLTKQGRPDLADATYVRLLRLLQRKDEFSES